MALGAAFVADLGLDRVPAVGLVLVQQGAQVLQLEGRRQVGGVKQCAQPGVVVGPTVRVHRAPGQLPVDGLGHFVHWSAALQDELARDVVRGFGLGVPMGPVRFGANQGAKGVPVWQHKAHFNRVAVAPKAGSLHVQNGGGWQGGECGGHGTILNPLGAATMRIFPLPAHTMSSSLLALIDDIATILDDVAILSKIAAKKTAGVLGDDLALNAQQVVGVSADRELPVVWAVCKGSLVNKLILVPTALLISLFIPWAVTPLLMVGGAYLCFEGFEKLAHKFLHSDAEDQAHEQVLREALENPAVDLLELERDKVKGAIRTDFVLSAEIIAITLGTVQSSPWMTQLTVLSGIALLMTFGVYGFVAGIVKMDDAGLYLSRRPGSRGVQALGRGLLRAAPILMKTLTVVGTAAMFLVGGGILVHGLGPVHHAIEALTAQLGGAGLVASVVQTVVPLLADGVVGVAAGGLVLLGLNAVQAVRRRVS